MKHIDELECLYSDDLLGCASLQENVRWALERLENNEDENDYEIAILASSKDDEEIIQLTRSIIGKHGNPSEFELEQDELIGRIHASFPLEPIPYPITEYEENDPRDYDGEGQSVTDFFQGKHWTKVNLRYQGGYHLTYLNENALIYYLPAFLLVVVSSKDPYIDIIERFYSFIGEARDRSNVKAANVLRMLSNEQKKILRKALDYGASKYGVSWDVCCNIKKAIKC